ncbi:hypothetical protein [Acidovorax sp. sic0104]|uniref:hypothetical protein n=1 Tax=Acidovorax sp. sic0104 TaxID=2854784 RepID=UPI001C47922E|nr:hypothetical protein [Acidovorax sp. sic0104]MBV7542125.1 hypothetical protein [Acidovorax sp. sic0104]
MNLGTTDRGLPENAARTGILNLIFRADEARRIARFVRIERSNELVGDLIRSAKARGDAEAHALLAELRLNLRHDLADANCAYVEGDAQVRQFVATAPSMTISARAVSRMKGLFTWIR